jgi:hypothetical protein
MKKFHINVGKFSVLLNSLIYLFIQGVLYQIAAAHVPTTQTDSQMNPHVSDSQAFLDPFELGFGFISFILIISL